MKPRTPAGCCGRCSTAGHGAATGTHGRATAVARPLALPRARAPPTAEFIRVRGAREHNLKGVDVDIPRDQFTVCCGPSGSGKTSLAMDTIYAEGQRRYVESLSAYARQFIGQLRKPKFDHIEGLSPAIAIEQKQTGNTPRSTVGTVTEIYDYLRILVARLGQPYCPHCDVPIGTQSTDEVIAKIMAHPAGTKLFITAPVEIQVGERLRNLWEEIRAAGYARIRVDQQTYSLDSPPEIDRRRKHNVEVVVDRVVIRPDVRSRLAGSVEIALALGKGVMNVVYPQDDVPEPRWQTVSHSQHFACEKCGRSFELLSPHHFFLQQRAGLVPGLRRTGHPDRHQSGGLAPRSGADAGRRGGRPVAPARQRALRRHAGQFLPRDGRPGRRAVRRARRPASPPRDARHRRSMVRRVAGQQGERPARFPLSIQGALSGLGRSLAGLARLSQPTGTPGRRSGMFGLRRQPAARRRGGGAIPRPHHRRVVPHASFAIVRRVQNWKPDADRAQGRRRAGPRDSQPAAISGRRRAEYLTLARPAPTLSGGESQRIRLAAQVGSGLCGVLYVLDEPTIGLHPRDNRRLLDALRKLRDLGNTLLVVEHDREVVASADQLLDFGPAAGRHGGADRRPGHARAGRASGKESVTGPYLSGKKAIPIPQNRRMAAGRVAAAAWHCWLAQP